MIEGRNVALDSAAVDALSALPSRGQSQIVLPLFLTSTLSSFGSQNTSEGETQELSFIPFDKHTEGGGAAENAETATDIKSYYLIEM